MSSTFLVDPRSNVVNETVLKSVTRNGVVDVSATLTKTCSVNTRSKH